MQNFFNLFKAAWDSLVANRLRSILTVMVIAVGITSIVGIETSIEILSGEIDSSLSREGNSSFALVSGTDPSSAPLTWRDGKIFSLRFKGGDVSVRSIISPAAIVSYKRASTDPVVSLISSDERWLELSALSLSEGRNITHFEAEASSGVCLIGDGVRRKLFNGESPLGRQISVDNRVLTVVGCIARQGSMMGGGTDQSVVFPGRDLQAQCIVTVTPYGEMAPAMEEARLLMRSVRRVGAGCEDGFTISTSQASASRIESIQKKLSYAALAIGLITLLGAAISLMNVMLVGVKERVREIGLRMALGERRSSVRMSFLAEAVLIGQMGAVVGSVFGLLAGNVVALSLESGMVVPWGWMARAMVICFAVSILAGTLPAAKAAALVPVDALRE